MKEEYIRITLTVPPSVNILYNNAKKWRTKTDEYKWWEKLALYEYSKQGMNYKIKWNNWLLVSYTYFMKIINDNWTKKKIDVFNFEKWLSDCLTKLIPGFKDEHIKKWFVEKIDSDRNEVEILIKEI